MAETDSINYYFTLCRRIEESRERLKAADRLFFSQTMNSYVTTDGMTLHSQGFDIQRNCNEHLDAKASIERNSEIAAFKNSHFQRYLNTLTKEQRLFLKMKYVLHREHLENEHIERECLLEIDEIEQAARYRFKLDEIEKADRIERAKQQAESMQAFMNSVNKSVISSGGRL